MSSSTGFPLIPEILRLICGHLQWEEPTLAGIARTCRMFQEPALDILWYELDGFYQLARCLPEHTWEEHVTPDDTYDSDDRDPEDLNYTLMLRFPLSSNDCERFMYYARKVRILDIAHIWSCYRVHPSIYKGLQSVLPNPYLLPNIQTLIWTREAFKFRFLHMFLGPRLEKIHYQFAPRSSSQLSFLTALSKYDLPLRVIKISFHDGPFNGVTEPVRRGAGDVISNAVYKWEDLRVLKVPLLTYSAMVELSKLHYLDVLEIEECAIGSDALVSPEGGFPALSQLWVSKCNSAGESIAIVKLLDNSALLSLRLSFKEVLSSSDWQGVFLAINQHCRYQSLQTLDCIDGCRLGKHKLLTPTVAEMVNADVLNPLFAFCHLLSVEITVSIGLYFPNPDITADIAKSWMRATSLYFLTRSRTPPPSRITLHDLIPFAEHCSGLKSLALPIDASAPPRVDAKTVSEGIIHETSLERLHVGPITNPRLVAAHLSAIFPSLERIFVAAGDTQKQWKRVEELVTLFSTARRQGRLHERQFWYESLEETDEEE